MVLSEKIRLTLHEMKLEYIGELLRDAEYEILREQRDSFGRVTKTESLQITPSFFASPVARFFTDDVKLDILSAWYVVDAKLEYVSLAAENLSFKINDKHEDINPSKQLLADLYCVYALIMMITDGYCRTGFWNFPTDQTKVRFKAWQLRINKNIKLINRLNPIQEDNLEIWMVNNMSKKIWKLLNAIKQEQEYLMNI